VIGWFQNKDAVFSLLGTSRLAFLLVLYYNWGIGNALWHIHIVCRSRTSSEELVHYCGSVESYDQPFGADG
jgi:hypothetical protein